MGLQYYSGEFSDKDLRVTLRLFVTILINLALLNRAYMKNSLEKLLFYFKKTSSPVAYCVLSIGMGTRNEDPKYNGLAHLTEHMLFKGTTKRNSVKISSTLERVGGDMNAYTTKERIVIYTTTLKEDIKKAVELLFEVVFSSNFPEEELKKEKVVVNDEIITYIDSPTELLYDTFESELFKGTSLGYSILGENKTLEKITSKILKDNLKKFFVPQNMTLTIAGNFNEDFLKDIVTNELNKWRKKASLFPKETKTSYQNDNNYIPYTSLDFIKKEYNSVEELSKGRYFIKEEKRGLRQAHCIIGCSAYSYYNSKKRLVLSLITNILGGPALNSRLSMSLREKHALVYQVEASYITYKDTGAFSIYFGCENKYLKKCISLVKNELAKIVNSPIGVKNLNAAKKQMIGQLSISSDNVESQCLTNGKSLLLAGRLTSIESLRSKIEAITPEEVQQVAQEVLDWKRMSRLVFY